MSTPAKPVPIPTAKTLTAAAKLSMASPGFRPLCLDYYADSVEGKVFLGKKPDKTSSLMKNDEEYTSSIEKLYQSDAEYIVQTKHSFYIVSGTLTAKRLNVREDLSDEDD
jgi:hypothetical protein